VTDKPPVRPSESVENFLKTVYTLQQQGQERVSTNSLAKALNILAPSVTDMARRMADQGLIDYRKYYGIRLTNEGEAVALRVLRRHRLIESYLVQELDYDLPSVHDDADRLEHVVSERFIQAIDAKLGHPIIDPHGEPIPAADGSITRRNLLPLTQIEDDSQAQVSRLLANDPKMLEYVLERGFELGTTVKIIDRAPFDGPITVLVNGQERIIGRSVAAHILVEMPE
jgi:DtxR family transcriptional regulator, Mn-dependent transcriptional regulator